MKIVMCLFLALVSFVGGWVIGKKKAERERDAAIEFLNVDEYKDYIERVKNGSKKDW